MKRVPNCLSICSFISCDMVVERRIYSCCSLLKSELIEGQTFWLLIDKNSSFLPSKKNFEILTVDNLLYRVVATGTGISSSTFFVGILHEKQNYSNIFYLVVISFAFRFLKKYNKYLPGISFIKLIWVNYRLQDEFQMSGLGTIQPTRRGLPKAITSTEGRPVGDYQVIVDRWDLAKNFQWEGGFFY